MPHGVAGCYIEPALEHYRCCKVFVTETRSEIIADVMGFSPQNLRIPRVLSADAATLSAQYLVEALQNTTLNADFVKTNDTHHKEFRSIEELFNIIPKG